MASITSLMNSSSTSSIYGNRNILTGLASGMDTESMIENAVSGIKTKIQSLLQKRTKVEWQQEAYRSIIDKAVNFNNKYTSYTSSTNLLSQSFFNNAVNTTTLGTYKDKISASGKTNSDIKINSVTQLAKAATYTVSGLAGQSAGGIASAVGGKAFDIGSNMTVSNVSGSLTFQYGGTNGTTFDITFDELEDLDAIEVKNANGTVKENATNAEKLAQAINNKLAEQSYTYTKNGYQETVTADKAVKAVAGADGRITFTDALGNGNKVAISSSTGKIKSAFGLGNEDDGDTSINVGSTSLANHNKKTSAYLADKELSVSLNGVTKKIDMSKVVKASDFAPTDDEATRNQKFQEALQTELDSAFGKDTDGNSKVTVSRGADGKLSFTPSVDGSTVTLGGSAVKAMGFESGDSNYINTSKKLKDLAGDLFTDSNRLGAVGAVNTSRMIDAAGNKVALGDDGNYYRVNADGKFLYDFKINGVNINVTDDTTVESLMTAINSNADAGVKVSYSKLTNEFKFTATETGANGKIEFDGMAKRLFGAVDTQPALSSDTQLKDIFTSYSSDNFGTDAFKITANINGVDKELTASVYWGGEGKGTTLADIERQLNKQLDGTGVTAKYDERTNSFSLTDADGKAVGYTYDEDSMAKRLSDTIKRSGSAGDFVAGQDAIMDVEINGKRFENLTRSSNSFDLDGLTVNVKGTFAEGDEDYEPVTFETTTDTDKIIDAIRDFVNDYNEMVTELKGAYSTTPAQQTDGSRYSPLTAEQEEGMTESEIASYNEKAKQGILFADTTLSSMYSKLLSAITPGGTDGQTLREIGIGTSYENGLTTISLDESKLRTALENNPDKVKDAFTKTREGGSSSDGLMQTLQNTLNTYVKTTGEPKGVLITRAGSIKAPTSINNNSLQTQINSIDSQIDRWQTKMSDQIDRYTTKFSRLEQLIAEMNSQASAFAGLMGGDTGY